MAIQALLMRIKEQHFPNPPASQAEIEAFERRAGWALDDDLRAFYLFCDGADLFGRSDAAYSVLSLSRISRARVALLGADDDAAGPRSWYAICANQDLDYMAIDVSNPAHGKYPIYDCWHEVFPDLGQCHQIATSFADFLEHALQSNGRMYWLKRR